jgi:hypothetical protein
MTAVTDNRGWFAAALAAEENHVPTPAEKLADLASAVAAHLRAHPHLNVAGVDIDTRMLIGNGHDQTARAEIVTSWAASFTAPRINLLRYQTDAHKVAVYVTATIHGIDIVVWTSLLDREFDFGLQPGASRDVTLAELRDILGTTEVTA